MQSRQTTAQCQRIPVDLGRTIVAIPTPFGTKRVARSARGRRSRANQRGAALVVALILLAVITLVGLAAIGTTIIQNKSASNAYDRQIAFQAAEAALRQAQVKIQVATATSVAPAGFEDCSTNNSPPTVCLADPFGDSNVPTAQIVTVPASAYSSALAATQPQYVVQYLGQFVAPTPTVRQISNAQNYGTGGQSQMADYYRITARSGDVKLTGERSVVTLQSTYRN